MATPLSIVHSKKINAKSVLAQLIICEAMCDTRRLRHQQSRRAGRSIGLEKRRCCHALFAARESKQLISSLICFIILLPCVSLILQLTRPASYCYAFANGFYNWTSVFCEQLTQRMKHENLLPMFEFFSGVLHKTRVAMAMLIDFVCAGCCAGW